MGHANVPVSCIAHMVDATKCMSRSALAHMVDAMECRPRFCSCTRGGCYGFCLC